MIDINKIKNDKRFFWTNHVKMKFLQYGISPVMIKKVISRPERIIDGIAPDTIAVMIRKDSKKTKKELWAMFQRNSNKTGNRSLIKIISAWYYPGISPQKKEVFIPEDTLEMILKKK